MQTIAKIGLALSLCSMCAFAETYNGKLIDATCEAKQGKQQTQECSPTASTLSFAIQTADGKVMKLDSNGNTRAAAAIKKDVTKNNATVSGSFDGQMLRVETLDVQ